MENKRLFTFGCSHTQYKWPSWADILGLSFKEFYNLGQAGSGIFYMLYQFTFGNEYFKFTKNDTLIFMLSNEARVDIVKRDNWLTKGYAFASDDVFGEKFFKQYSETHAIESSYIYVYYLKEMLDKIGCRYEIIYAFESNLETLKDIINKQTSSIWHKKYKLTNTNIPSLTDFSRIINDRSYNFIDTQTKKLYTDGHFTISTHLQYVKKYLSKYYNEENDKIVKQWEIKVPLNDYENVLLEVFWETIHKNKIRFTNGVIENEFKLKKLL